MIPSSTPVPTVESAESAESAVRAEPVGPMESAAPIESTEPVKPVGPAEAKADQALRVDMVLAGRHVSTGQYLAGLMAAAELETAGRVDRLPHDLFPDVDPVLVQEVWERACAVAWRAAERYFTARQDPAVLAGLKADLEEAGHAAMAGMVGRSLSVVRMAGLAHPADGAVEREHGPV